MAATTACSKRQVPDMAFEAHQVAVKVFAEADPSVTPEAYIRAFHTWIQIRAITDELLVDVTDYSHVGDGPGVLLIAHGAQYGVNTADGRLGLTYAMKRDEPGPLADKLRTALSRALAAAKRLEGDLRGKIRFGGGELQIRIDSRLVAPNTDETFDAAKGDIDTITAAIYGGTPATLERTPDAKRTFTVTARSDQQATVGDLLARLAA